eukprot:TRINITY_DN109409_c0_g1_i1.p1 TRINITY_DN109409_c0_g1~~TRINITY_DN109409_c0_g1_i1.p1  ORF type:complete len:343 (+),score=106.55 TRINITY_DN109409_c0_g1_i1:83-1111(+)
MADRENELMAEKETSALQKLQAAAGIVNQEPERLDWMYEQNSASTQLDDDAKMNQPVSGQTDKDMEDVKNLQESTAGSLFLRSATKTTEDMLRKLREDPLFQIKRQEQAARANMMANPLMRAKILKQEAKQAQKDAKKAKKAAKKEKKAAKKEKKALKKAKKGKKSSSDSDSSDSAPAAPVAPRDEARSAPVKRDRSPPRRAPSPDLSKLGPNSTVLSKREELEQRKRQQRDAALASRGVGRNLTEEEKQRRVDAMRADAQKHERHKDKRIAAAEIKDKEIEDQELKMRQQSALAGEENNKLFGEMRKQVYMENTEANVADRLKNQRHRRQKNMNDPLERDG